LIKSHNLEAELPAVAVRNWRYQPSVAEEGSSNYRPERCVRFSC